MTAQKTVEAAVQRGFAAYVHWPFCKSKCPYCDFNSHVRESVDHRTWRQALIKQIDLEAERLKRYDGATSRFLGSIFFGGGTPSLMAPETVAGVIERLRYHWPQRNDLEITLEANPTSVEAALFADFAAAGVNRVSLGVQSLKDDPLRFLGRQHSALEACKAIEIARKFFARYSFDLIYARPGQTEKQWRAELSQALDLVGDHLSLYQLTIEENTAFHAARRRGDLQELDSDCAASLYEVTQDLMAAAGLPAYEVSNHANPGQESRHNLVYWRYGDYLGIGPGAHGRLSLTEAPYAFGEMSQGQRGSSQGVKLSTRQHRAPECWLDAMIQKATGQEGRGTGSLSTRERFEEILMMGLRLEEGVPETTLRAETGRGFRDWLDQSTLERLVKGGLLVFESSGAVLRTTLEGRQRLDAVLAHLLF